MKSRSEWQCICGQYKAPQRDRACTACRLTLVPLNPIATDQRAVAERYWTAPAKPEKAQKPCDHGLFSDDAKQEEIFK